MADVIGTQAPPGPVLTREVRWFQDGSMPADVLAWFTEDHTVGQTERRVDDYDCDALRHGVGLKRRDGRALDAKYRIVNEQDVLLSPGVVGSVEEWLKVSGPRIEVRYATDGDQIRVVKEIVSRRFDLEPRNKVISGCDVELAEVTVGSLKAWSLCFETYGEPELRWEALDLGIRRVLEDRPPPQVLRFEEMASCGYPAWLNRGLTDED